MNYVNAYTYDAQTIRWFAPDPSEQFHNPYLAMGRTKREESLRGSDLASGQPAGAAVMYVDPDGEFAIIAALIIAKKIAAKVAIGAKFAGAYAKAGAKIVGTASQFAANKVGAVAAKSATKTGIKAGLKSGSINTISNYDSEEGLGWHTLGDFAAGYAGASFSYGSGSVLIGMGIGGFGTWGVSGADFDYGGAQSFVGGALSVWSGMGKAVKAKQTLFEKSSGGASMLAKKKTNIFANTLHQNGDAFLKFGTQASMYDFAYTKQEDYLGRTWSQHLGIFAVGGTMGAFTQNYFTENTSWRNEFGPDLARSGIGFVGFAGEYTMSGYIKKRFDGFKDDPNKIGIFSGKWLEQTIDNFGTR